MQTCRWCRAQIRWLTLEGKKAHPVEWKSVPFRELEKPEDLYGMIVMQQEEPFRWPFVASQYTTLGDLRQGRLFRSHADCARRPVGGRN